jgi:DnaK suppressor protein
MFGELGETMEENDGNIDMDHFKEQLLRLREELREIEDSGNEAAGIVELDQTRVGRLSRMDALQSQAMSIESRRRRDIRTKRIEAALQRIERGEFGLCLECSEQINPKRLAFDPTSLFCIDCAKRKDR